MKPARIILLVVAIVAGGLAAYLATRNGSRAPQVAKVETVQQQLTKVLVAKANIGVGVRMTPSLVQWQSWPVDAVRGEYVDISKVPDAPEQLTNTVTRFEIFAGEPITEAKLVRTSQGYLSAVLARGMRAVSLQVDAVSAAGGFIVPNDRVDLVQVLKTPQGRRSRVLLQNVKVLAIGQKLGENTSETKDPKDDTFTKKTIATLEVDPLQAQAVVAAEDSGKLTLVLRSILDFSAPVELNATADASGVQMIRYGQTKTVTSSSEKVDTNADSTNDNAAYQPADEGPVFTPSANEASNPTASGGGDDQAPPPALQ